MLLADREKGVGDRVGEQGGDRQVQPDESAGGQAEAACVDDDHQDDRAEGEPDQDDLDGGEAAERDGDPQEAGSPQQGEQGQAGEAAASDCHARLLDGCVVGEARSGRRA